jgi:hypothetical protein
MFERTFTFWRRLVGIPSEPAHVSSAESATATQEDRRLWVRYAADADARIQLADQPGSEMVAVKVRDMSQGGANLIADKPIQAGQILSLEMPFDDGEVYTILACVVRANPENGQWSLGCVFSRELSHEDLSHFGAEKVKHNPEDQRTWVRYDSTLRACYQPIGQAEGPHAEAQVLNISASGIGLLMREPSVAGTLINLELLDRNGQSLRTILACIVHTTSRANGEYAAGCNFIRELSEQELQALL